MEKGAEKAFLKYLYEKSIPVTVFLVCNVKLQGVIIGLDDNSFLLKRDNQIQCIYKTGVTTIVAGEPLADFGEKN